MFRILKQKMTTLYDSVRSLSAKQKNSKPSSPIRSSSSSSLDSKQKALQVQRQIATVKRDSKPRLQKSGKYLQQQQSKKTTLLGNDNRLNKKQNKCSIDQQRSNEKQEQSSETSSMITFIDSQQKFEVTGDKSDAMSNKFEVMGDTTIIVSETNNHDIITKADDNNNIRTGIISQSQIKLRKPCSMKCCVCRKSLEKEQSIQLACLHRCHKKCAVLMKWRMHYRCDSCDLRATPSLKLNAQLNELEHLIK